VVIEDTEELAGFADEGGHLDISVLINGKGGILI